jgi:hypothetical protein
MADIRDKYGAPDYISWNNDAMMFLLAPCAEMPF